MTSSRFQNIIEKLLLSLAFAVIACHCLLAAFQYLIPYRQFRPYVQWAAVALLAISFFYLVASLLASKNSRAGVLSFLKRMLTYEQILLLLIFFCFLLSCYVNGKEFRDPFVYFGVHDWFIYDVFICFFLAYPLAKAVGTEKAKKAIELLIHLVVITYSVFTIISLWHIFRLETISYPSGEEGGMTAEYALMLGRHYNLTGMIAATMFCLCVYMAFAKDRFVRILYVVFGIVQLIVVYLCNSRTVFVGVLVFTVFAAFSLAWNFFFKRKIFQRLLFSFIIANIVGISVWFVRDAMFGIFESVTHFSKEIAAYDAENLFSLVRSYHPSNLTLSLHNKLPTTNYALLASASGDAARQLTDLSNRANIWTSALRVMVSSPRAFFFGVTPYGVTGALQEIGGYWSEAAHAHNSILQIGAAIGVPAMALYILFLFTVAAKCLRLVFVDSVTKDKQQVVIPSAILCFTAINMAEAYLFAYFSVVACFFYLFCGATVAAENRFALTRCHTVRIWILRFLVVVLCIAFAVFLGQYFTRLNSQNDSNLLRGTDHGSFNYRLTQKGFDAKMKQDGEGIKVIMNSHDENGWCVLLFDDGHVREILSGPYGDAYTISFEAKSNIANAEICVASRQEDGKENQVDFGTVKLTSTNEWEPVSLVGILRGVKATKQGVYFNLKNNPAGTEISIRKLKLTKIDRPSSDNLLYGTNLGTVNFTLLDKGYDAVLEAEGEGIKVKSNSYNNNRDGGDGWLVLFFDDGNSRNLLADEEGEAYTLSFEVKTNTKNTVMQIRHSQGNKDGTQIDFGTAVIEKPDKWNQIILTGTVTGYDSTSQGIYFDLRDNPAGTEISIRNLKLIKEK